MADQLLTTAEVLRRSGISRQVLYNYIDISLIHHAERTPGGRYKFDPAVVKRIALIQRLQRHGYSLRDIRETFRQGFSDNAQHGPGGASAPRPA